MVGGSVDERRLRPVYDALENLNNKQAIKLADAILKKQKDFSCAKALKALALVRSGKCHEAVPLLENIKSTTAKLDDSTLQAMTMCYKESSSVEGIVAIYELAVQQTKDNEEFLSHLFMAYVRVGNYAKQQQAAMNLYKVFPKNPYYFWAVMSNVMQAIAAVDEKKKKMLLMLAERMVSKLKTEGRVEAQEENDLYAMILQYEEKYEVLLNHLKSEDKLAKIDLEIECLEKLNRWSDLNLTYKRLLVDQPDQWSYINGLIDTCMKLKGYVPDAPIDTENEQPIYKVEDLKEFLTHLKEKNSRLRGPLIGLLQLSKRCSDNELLRSTLTEYFDVFGGKPCCYGDIRPYVELLDTSIRKKFLDSLRASVTPCQVDADHKAKVNILFKQICIECLSRQLGEISLLSKEEQFETAKRYVAQFHEALELGKDLNPTESQFGDALILLAVYILLDLNNEKGDDSMIWHIVLLLEEAVEKSPSFAQFKLLLVFLYSKLGAIGPCEKLLGDMEIKYIIYDSLGYLICNGVYTSGQFQLTQRIFDAFITFYNSSKKDIPEQLISAYKYGSFRQVTDFTRLKNRIDFSAHRHIVMIEDLIVDVVKYCNSTMEIKKRFEGGITERLRQLEVTEEKTRQFYDNRDLNIFFNFDKINHQSHVDKSFQDQVLYIRYRFICLKIITDCFNSQENVEQNTNQVNQLLEELKSIVANFEKERSPSKWLTIHHQQPSELRFIFDVQHHDIVQMFAQIFVALFDTKEMEDDLLEHISHQFAAIKKILQDVSDDVIRKMVVKGEEELFDGTSLRNYVYFLEMTSITAIMFCGMKNLLKHKFPASGRRTRKKKSEESTKEEKLMNFLEEFCMECYELLRDVLTMVDDIKRRYVDKRLDDKTLLDIFEKTNSTTVTKIWDKVQTSYQQSILETNQLLKLKMSFFQELSRL